MKNTIGMITVVAFVFASCVAESDHEPGRVVVEAYLSADEPVKDIAVKYLKPLDGAEDAAPVADAIVTLVKSGDEFPLEYNPASSKFEYTGSVPLEVSSGDAFEVRVEAHGRVASAGTIVPPAPGGLRISSTKIKIPPIESGIGVVDRIRELFADARLQLTWDNPEDQYYFVVIERRTNSIDPVLPSQLRKEVTDLLSSFRFISEPTKEPAFGIVGVALETYGLHVAKVYRVNPEYVALFRNPPQDSRDLNEPATNVENGLGIFSAFASDSIFFEVTR